MIIFPSAVTEVGKYLARLLDFLFLFRVIFPSVVTELGKYLAR